MCPSRYGISLHVQDQTVATQPELRVVMAPATCNKKGRPSQTVKRPCSSGKADRSVGADVTPRVKSACGPTTMWTEDLLTKEEEYKQMNAELEAKVADTVKQADQLMREHNEVLLTDTTDEEEPRLKHNQRKLKDPSVKMVSNKEVTSAFKNMHIGKEPHSKTRSSEAHHINDIVGSPEQLLANVISGMEEEVDHGAFSRASEFNAGERIADARVHVLRAKVRIMQEELDQLSSEYYKKDDLNDKLRATIKELEDDGAKLQKTISIQKVQIEKHRASADESSRNCDALRLEVCALKKELEDLNKSHKQAATSHSSTEVRLNRALEELEKVKAQINRMNQMSADKIGEEHRSKENLLAENKLLRKQKEELILAFKKQLKLIDVLNRQKMHFEAAKLLSFQEEEFTSALDWGPS
ncbi:testis-expressed protein 9 isoform X1 [Takifugu rubripes]|uniref:Testis expressed 9 n=3 Tax=Takifugu rubripes TaxID=31033 RepID=H2V9J6_TAKRU|nr:testis-expressed protein 9 isoform X1 [Takifugu rubripes]